jgi:hypothetical protein
VIHTLAENSIIKGAPPPAGDPGEARVYIRLGMRVPGANAKEMREVPVAGFPIKAPLPAGSPAPE